MGGEGRAGGVGGKEGEGGGVAGEGGGGGVEVRASLIWSLIMRPYDYDDEPLTCALRSRLCSGCALLANNTTTHANLHN